jgi:hypothetical protein
MGAGLGLLVALPNPYLILGKENGKHTFVKFYQAELNLLPAVALMSSLISISNDKSYKYATYATISAFTLFSINLGF